MREQKNVKVEGCKMVYERIVLVNDGLNVTREPL